MSNPYYTVTGAPVAQSRGYSSTIRNEYGLINTGFDAVYTAMLLRGLKAGETWTGTHVFTGATVTVATQAASDSSTKAASTAFVNSVAFLAALPAQAGNAGKFVTTDGVNASWLRVSPLPTVVVNTSSTTWTCPANVTKAKVTVVGGGGSGEVNTSTGHTAGGSGGGTAIKWLTVTPGVVYTVTVGAGGAATVTDPSSGNNGGSSSFSGSGISTITGGGGLGANSSSMAGGTASGGDLNISGGPSTRGGGAGVNYTSGGGTYLSMGGSYAQDGTGYGGGAGSVSFSSTGKAGANGVVIIEY